MTVMNAPPEERVRNLRQSESTEPSAAPAVPTMRDRVQSRDAFQGLRFSLPTNMDGGHLSNLEGGFDRMQWGRFGVRDSDITSGKRPLARHQRFAFLLVGLVALTGCTTTPDRGDIPTITPSPLGEDGQVVGTPLPAPGGLPAGTINGTPATARVELGEVVWTTAVDPAAGAPATPVAVVAPDAPAIYAVLPVIRMEPGTTVTASWTYNDTPLDTLTSTISVSEAREGGWLEFHLDRTGPDPWPDGTYGITVSADGQEVQSGQVRIENE